MSASATSVEITFSYIPATEKKPSTLLCDKGAYPGDPKSLIQSIAFEFKRLACLAKKFTFKASLDSFNKENVSRISLAFKAVLDAKRKRTAGQEMHKNPSDWFEEDLAKDSLERSQKEVDVAEAAFQTAKRETGIEVLFEEDQK